MKTKYLNEIRNALAFYPLDLQEEIMQWFLKKFEEGYAQGLKDSEIIERLGPVDEALIQIEERIANGQWNKSGRTEINMDSLEHGLRNLGSVIGNVLQGTVDVVNQAINRVEEVANTKPSIPTVDEVSSEVLEGMKDTLEVHCVGTITDIVFYPGGNQALYTFTTKTASGQGKSLIQVEENETETKLHITKGEGVFGSSNLLEVYVPQNVKNIDVLHTGGNVTIKEFELSTLQINSTSGNLNLESLLMDKIQLKSITGAINVTGVKARLEAKTVSGNIRVQKHIDGVLSLQSTSGNIHVENFSEVPKCILENVSGNLFCNLYNENYSAYIETESGNFKNLTKLTGYAQNQGKWILGQGEGVLKLTTVTGNIQLKTHQ
ncbi:MAG: DUF4097 family beta strand repeat protein [Solobacterium sp.]|nr:DUF4097 family beta strand repeat protein [Solobacterium sp.]